MAGVTEECELLPNQTAGCWCGWSELPSSQHDQWLVTYSDKHTAYKPMKQQGKTQRPDFADHYNINVSWSKWLICVASNQSLFLSYGLLDSVTQNSLSYLVPISDNVFCLQVLWLNPLCKGRRNPSLWSQPAQLRCLMRILLSPMTTCCLAAKKNSLIMFNTKITWPKTGPEY